MSKHVSLLLGLCLILPVALAQAEESRDPFQPATWSGNKTAKTETQDAALPFAHPLEANPLAAYILVGVAISQEQAIGVIKAPDTKDYFVKVGDVLGKEGGHIEAMNSDGIAVNTGNNVITIPVSNKIEIKKDDQDN